MGSEFCGVRLTRGRVSGFDLGSTLEVEVRRAAKKRGTILCARFADFNQLSKLNTASDYLFASQPDEGQPKTAAPTDEARWKNDYDAELAQALPALQFHRAWHTFADVFKRGILVDGRMTWFNGRQAWNGAALPFGWSEANNAMFSPRPRIDEAFELYGSDTPSRRLRVVHTTHRVDPAPNLEPLLDDVERLARAPLCAVSRNNIDAVVLAPNVVIELLNRILPAFVADAHGCEAFSRYFAKPGSLKTDVIFGTELRLSDCATHAAFGFDHAPLDARGQRTQDLVLIEAGHARDLAASDLAATNIKKGGKNTGSAVQTDLIKALKPNGHALLPDGTSSVFYPVLEALTPDALPDYQPGFTAQIAERTLVIQAIQFIEPSDSSLDPFIFLPEGGLLYENGKLFGITPPQRLSVSLTDLFIKARPATKSFEYAGFVLCALAFGREILF